MKKIFKISIFTVDGEKKEMLESGWNGRDSDELYDYDSSDEVWSYYKDLLIKVQELDLESSPAVKKAQERQAQINELLKKYPRLYQNRDVEISVWDLNILKEENLRFPKMGELALNLSILTRDYLVVDGKIFDSVRVNLNGEPCSEFSMEPKEVSKELQSLILKTIK